MKPNSFQDTKFPAEKWPSESPALLWASSHSLVDNTLRTLCPSCKGESCSAVLFRRKSPVLSIGIQAFWVCKHSLGKQCPGPGRSLSQRSQEQERKSCDGDSISAADTPLSSEPGAGTVISEMGLLHFEQRNRRATDPYLWWYFHEKSGPCLEFVVFVVYAVFCRECQELQLLWKKWQRIRRPNHSHNGEMNHSYWIQTFRDEEMGREGANPCSKLLRADLKSLEGSQLWGKTF